MFRLLKLKPPHGWSAVAWELGIVTLGVVIALAAQQWAEGLSWNSKVAATKQALRAELQEHYGYAVEYRAVYPCLQAQLDQLRDRVLSSRSVLHPAPIYSEDTAHYVLRLPSKGYANDAWQAAVDDGTIRILAPVTRRQLAGHYNQLPEMAELLSATNTIEPGLVALTHPLRLDPTVDYLIVKDIEQLSFKNIHKPDEVQEAPAQPIELVDDDDINRATFDVSEELSHRGPIQAAPGLRGVLVNFRGLDPAFVLLTLDICRTDGVLRFQRVEFLFKAVRATFPSVDRASFERRGRRNI